MFINDLKSWVDKSEGLWSWQRAAMAVKWWETKNKDNKSETECSHFYIDYQK